MTVLKFALLAAAATLSSACGGGDSEACRQADETEVQIRAAADADGISPLGICGVQWSQLTGLVGSEERAVQYLNACRQLDDQRRKCRGD